MSGMKSLKQIVEQLKEVLYIETVIQFGSSLERADSRDIDLCIITTRPLSRTEEMAVRKNVPEKYDLNFYDELPLHIKKQILTTGNILFTTDYYRLLKRIQYVDFEYPRYKAFLEEYHKDMVAALWEYLHQYIFRELMIN